MNIIARKPRYREAVSEWDRGIEFVVVERGPNDFVFATANPHSLEHGEWFWGTLFLNSRRSPQTFQ